MDLSDPKTSVRSPWPIEISALLILALLAMVSSCNDQGLTGTNESSESPELKTKKSATAAKVAGLPSHGSTPLPGPEADQPAADLLQSYVDQHPENPYVAIVGNWNHTENHYEYKTVPLTFKQSTITDANGQRGYYHFQVEDDGGKPLAALAGLIPATSTAQEKMSNWLIYVSPTGQEGTSSASASGYQPPMMKSFSEPGGGGGGCAYAMCVEGPEVVVTGDALNGDPWADGGWADENWPPSGGGAPSNYPASGGGGSGGGGTGSNIIITNSSFENNPCLSSVYNQAGQSPTFDNILNEFDSEFSVANLIFSTGVDENYLGANAVTYPPSNYNIEIMFNPSNLDRPSLSVAGTLIHELIHAEMYRKLLSAAEDPAISWTKSFIQSIRNDFPGIYDYYRRYKNWQHQQMASHYRDIMEQGLREFDNSLSDEIYEALAWNGLMGNGKLDTETWLYENSTVTWEELSQQDRGDIIAANVNFRNNNPNCQ